ncbi:MAG: ribonuclease HI [Lachnospiraceae bacterium]|nr:ribonuclease HI [Lachnospiraceae bacterium]
MSEHGKELMMLLRNIYNDHDFVCGTMSNCGGEEAWKEMCDFIKYANEQCEKITSDDILALSLSLGEKYVRDKDIVCIADSETMAAAL